MRNPPPTQWTNSWFGRLVGTTVGMFSIGSGASLLIAEEGSFAAWFLPGTAIVLAGFVLIIALWTSRLEVEGHQLVARHFYGTRSMRLSSVAAAEPAIVGLIFRSDDGNRVRSLVSGRAFDEFWHTRAETVCDQVLRLSHAERATET